MTMKIVVLVCLCSIWSIAAISIEIQSVDCTPENCKLDANCMCSVTKPIINNGPQLITLSFDEALVQTSFEFYWKNLFYGRKNPDGRPISGTFYVPHEYTDYNYVNDLFVNNFEIGVHSISKNFSQEYWRTASVDTLVLEFGGQREIISKFANIPINQILGVRTPQLQIHGDVSFDAYMQAGLQYDSSWPSFTNQTLYPYTLDYVSDQRCEAAAECPLNKHKGFWVLPILDFKGSSERGECNVLSSCDVNGTAKEQSDWLIGEIKRIKETRAPITLMVTSGWFQFTENSLEAFTKVLDWIGTQKDIFLVSHNQVYNYMKNPVPLDKFTTKVNLGKRPCKRAMCKYITKAPTMGDDGIRYLGSCIDCPDRYPWIGNTQGN